MKALFKTILLFYLLSFFCLRSFSQNQPFADSVLNSLHNNKDQLNDSLINSSYLLVAENSSDPASIINYAEKALSFYERKRSSFNIARSHLLLGQGYILRGELTKALDHNLKAAHLYKSENNDVGLAAAYNYIAQTYSKQQNTDNAVDFYKKAISLVKSNKDTIREASFFLNLGYEFYKGDQLDSALVYYQKSSHLFKEKKHEIGLAYNLGNSGLVFFKQGAYEKAERTLGEAIEILEKYGDTYAVIDYRIKIAEILSENNDLNKALHHLLESYRLAQNEGFKEQIRDITLKLSEIYDYLGVFEKAYHFQSQYIAYRDSINNEETIRQMADLRTEYEVAQKQGEIDLLTANKAKQKIIALSLGFGVLLIGVLAYVQYRNHRREIAINKQLSAQKAVLHKQRDQLEALNNTKDRFFSIISHDLRGPVNAFNGISSLIQHYISINDLEQLVEVSQYIDKSASQLSSLLDNLLNWAVSQQGHFPYLPEKIRFCEMMDEVVEIFQTTAHSKNISLKIDCEKELMVWADRNSLTTIIRNLVNNALKFTNPNGTVTILAYAKGNWSIIKVIDTGVGIAPEKLKSIFKLIAKKNSSGTAGEKGLGLGLQLAYDFSLLNKGSIKVESKEDVGTTFILKIPRHNDQLVSVESEAKTAESVS